MSKAISLALHGGAGTITRNDLSPERESEYRSVLQFALDSGYALLGKGKSAMETVEAVVCILEDSPLFNAGKGSVFNHAGKHEMDACIMNGKNRTAGAVAGIHGIKNPVSLARLVMEKSEHVFLTGEGAVEFARLQNIPVLPEDYFYDELRYAQWQQALQTKSTFLDHSPLSGKKFGTVGAVALDISGNLAAATSTGGVTNKKYGRVGDSPVIGAGTYANNKTCAISCTGTGEFFLRSVVAYDVSCLMEYKGMSLHEACREVIQQKLLSIGGDGGLIAADANGNICLEFNTEGMYRAARTNSLSILEIYK